MKPMFDTSPRLPGAGSSIAPEWTNTPGAISSTSSAAAASRHVASPGAASGANRAGSGGAAARASAQEARLSAS